MRLGRPQRGAGAVLASPAAAALDVPAARQTRRSSLRNTGVTDTCKGVFSGVYGCFRVSARSAFETVNAGVFYVFVFLYYGIIIGDECG